MELQAELSALSRAFIAQLGSALEFFLMINHFMQNWRFWANGPLNSGLRAASVEIDALCF